MRISRCVGLTALSVIAATAVPLIATGTSAGGVRLRTTPPIGKQLAELKGGTSVAISGTTAIVGAAGSAKRAGRAYVVTKTASGWKQTAELKGSDTVANDSFGNSVAVSGSTAVVGAVNEAKSAGRAYLFTRYATGWYRVADLKGSDTDKDDLFGSSVAISGTIAVVGAEGTHPLIGPLGVSHAYVFEA